MRSKHRGHRSTHTTQQTSGMASEADVEEEDVSATAENVPDEILMWEKDALERLWEEIPLHGYLGGGQSGCMRQHLAPHSRNPACACSGAGRLTGAQQACPPCLHPAMTPPDVLHPRASRSGVRGTSPPEPRVRAALFQMWCVPAMACWGAAPRCMPVGVGLLHSSATNQHGTHRS